MSAPSPQSRPHAWTEAKARAIHALPFPDLLYRAQTLHRAHFDPTEIETAALLSIKTGGCAEDCGYCAQSAHHDTGLQASKLMEVDDVVAAARRAKAGGANRFCMGAAWRAPKERDLDRLLAMIRKVKALGLETCATLGMLTRDQAERLEDAGLDYYNHNVDTSPAFYPRIISTRTLDDRLETLRLVQEAGMKVCSGGIVGMGEEETDRIAMLVLLANLSPQPASVPINTWNAVPGTPVQETATPIAPIALVRLVALARILMPESVIRLSAGRHAMSDELQALCFLAGANSVFVGDVLLTTDNAAPDRDAALFASLGLRPVRSAARTAP